MDFAAFVATIIVVLFLVTIVMAAGSYGAYKLRERRRPPPLAARARSTQDGAYFERVDAAALDSESPT
jgi:hypothetical protein